MPKMQRGSALFAVRNVYLKPKRMAYSNPVFNQAFYRRDYLD